MTEEFMGMMITLKKRMVCTNTDDTTKSQYLMFGHYDGADIACTDKWYKLRPKGVEEIGGNVNITDSFWDKYTLKLYFPEQKYCDELEKKGFAYQIWKDLGAEDRDEKCDTFLGQFPFLSIAMINLSEKCVESEGNLTEKMQEAVLEATKRAKVELRTIHCCIMPSIGYADFVLLFLSDNLKKVMTVLDNLKKDMIQDQDKSYAMLSNSYAISGFAKAGLKNLQNLKELQDVKLSIRVNLRDGVSATQFKNFFDQELGEICKGRSIKEELDLYQVFGNSDCLILSDMSFDFFIPLFYDKKLLNPAHELFEKYIQHTRSSIRVKVGTKEELPSIESDGKQTYERYQKKFEDLVGRLQGYVEKYDTPTRIVNGLQTIMKAYLSLVQFSHCFDIEKVMGEVFKAVTDNVGKTLELIEADKENSFRYSEEMLQALGIFREKVEDYLTDLRRSDRLFIEGQSLSHPSIGSATKLLFFYNCFINNIAQKLVQTEEEGRKICFTFLVTSGGCDVTTAYDLFSYMDPLEELVHPLIIVSIPEMSLYDFRGTMFRLLHECFHFCGERKRKKRLESLLRSLSINTAWVIGNGLGKSFDWQLQKIENLSVKYHSPEDRMKIVEEGKRIVQEELVVFIQELGEELFRKMSSKFSPPKLSSFYGRNLYYEAMEALETSIWRPIEMENNKSFLYYVYHKFMLCQKEIAKKWIAELRKRDIFFSDADLLKETSLLKLEMEKEGKFDFGEESLIREILRSYTGGSHLEERFVQIPEGQRVTEEIVVSNLEELFKECFADCMAAGVMKLPVEDFLLCFLYETWDYEKAFPDMFRISIELKVLYGIEGGLNIETRRKIKERVQYWKEIGFEYKRHRDDYVEDACEWIDKLLKDYGGDESSYVGMDCVEDYLKTCLDYYRVDLPGIVTDISSLSELASLEDIYQLLEGVRATWKDIAKPGKESV